MNLVDETAEEEDGDGQQLVVVGNEVGEDEDEEENLPGVLLSIGQRCLRHLQNWTNQEELKWIIATSPTSKGDPMAFSHPASKDSRISIYDICIAQVFFTSGACVASEV